MFKYLLYISVSIVLLTSTQVVFAQCNTTVSFDVNLSAAQTANQNLVLSGTLTQVQFNLNFSANGAEWPADMIVIITGANGNCMAGEGFNINPPSSCFAIDFPGGWTSSTNGFYTYTMSAAAANISGDGTWLFSVQNGWTSASSTNYDLDIVLFGVCDQGDCMNEWACNYNPNAAYEDNSFCIYPEFGYDCNGNCNADEDGDGVCDMFEVPGCDDLAACNFSLLATDNDGSCGYANLDEDCEGNSLIPHFNNAPEDISVSCSMVPNAPTVYASISSYASVFEAEHNPDGNCYAAVWGVTIVMDESTFEGNCPGEYSIVRHWVGTDCMGRQVEHTQTISVIDNTAPVFTFGIEPVTTTCPILPAFEQPIAEDVCSSPVVYNIEAESILPGECDGRYSIYRLVTATDACGNSSTVEQVIEVNDETGPIWSEILPEQVISSAIETEDFGMPVAMDLCSDVTIQVVSELGPGICPLAVELTRTFIATDACGNESVPFVQVINEDTDLFTFISATSDATCSYSSDGYVVVETYGAVPPYDLYFGNVNPEALSSGEYTVTVSDANLCSTTLDYSIFAPPALQLSLESTEPNCSDIFSGTVTATAAGGTGDLTYDWGGINPLAVAGGNYTITIEDENGCTLSDEVIVESAIIPVVGVIDGNTEVMYGDSSVYEYTYTAGSSYEWIFSGADSLVVSNIFAISLLWSTEGPGYVCVTETNAFGCIGDQVCIETNVSVGVNEQSSDMSHENLYVFPNPSSGKFSCHLPESLSGVLEWSLIDLGGAIVGNGSLSANYVSDQTFDFSHLSNGSYLLILGDHAISVQIAR